MADLTGQLLGQYQIGAQIGRGGMASVFRARQLSMDRDVALKVISASLSASPEFLARFEREAHVIARLQHPHILPVIDFGRSGEFAYLVMRLVEGGTLSRRIADPTLTLREIASFLDQIASALEYAHQLGVVHRDLKPNNVLLDEFDNCYLTDFGIAKMLAGDAAANLTATNAVMGTPAYMAPEQWRSEAVDARADLYALGVMLYELLLGAQPFDADTPFGMMFKHIGETPPAPCRINPALPETVERVVMRALAKNPAERYSSATACVRALRAALSPLPAAILDAPLPRATPQQIAEAAAPTPAPSSAPPEAGVRPPVAISPPPVYRALVSTPPVAAPAMAAPRSAPRRRGMFGWVALLAGALAIGALALAAIYLLDGDGADPLPPVIAEHEASPTSRATLPATRAALPTAAGIAAPITDPAAGPTATAEPLPTPTREVAIGGTCSGAPSPRLTPGEQGRVTLDPPLPSRVRAGPSTDSAYLTSVPPGRVFSVLSGPLCDDDGRWWWQVRFGDLEGWMAEGAEGEYYLEPVS